MIKLELLKAQRVVRDEPVEDVEIRIKQEAITDGMTLAEAGQVYDLEAEKLVDALWASLPGGVVDRVLIQLMQRKAGFLVVAHDPPSVVVAKAD